MDTPSAVSAQDPGVTTTNTTPSGPIDEWLDRVTSRLAVDRELQLEVRLELRSHVDESIAEFREAGRSEDDARDEALKTLGDENDLSDQLWRANRRRMKLRALAAWAIRLALPPAAIALVIILSLGGLTAFAVLRGLTSAGRGSGDPLVDRAEQAMLAAAPTEDVRLLLELDRAPTEDGRFAIAKRLVDLRPNDRAAFVQYAATALDRPIYSEHFASTGPNGEVLGGGDDDSEIDPVVTTRPTTDAPDDIITTTTWTMDETRLEETLAILAEGERVDPDNAFYPLMASSLLYRASVKTVSDPTRVHVYEQRPGETANTSWENAVVTNPERHALARAALLRAAARPVFQPYTAELVKRRYAAVPASHITDLVMRARVEASFRLPWLKEMNNALSMAVDEAPDAARSGSVDDAPALLAAVRSVTRKVAANAEGIIDFYNAYVAYTFAGHAEALIHQEHGDRAAAAAEWASYDAAYRRTTSLRLVNDAQGNDGGLLSSVTMNTWVKPDRAGSAPVRRAEYAAVDQVAVAALAACVLGLAAFYGTIATIRWITSSRSDRPRRLSIGWRRVARIVGLGAMLPIVLYLAYAWLTPLGGRALGLYEARVRLPIEYGILGLTVITLVSWMTRRAVTARMRELRLPEPPSALAEIARPSIVMIAAAILAAAACLAVAALATSGIINACDTQLPRRVSQQVATPAVLAAWMFLGYAAIRIAHPRFRRWRATSGLAERERRLREPAPLYGWAARAAFAPLVIAAVVIALVGLPLRWVESRSVAAAVNDGQPRVFLGTLDRSVLRDVRDELVGDARASAPQAQDVAR